MSEGSDAEDTTLLGIGTWTKQGPATLVLRENSWAVLVPGLRKRVIEAAWTVLGEKPAPEEFLDRLVEAGELESADKLTALLFGFHDGTSAVFGVKGTTPIAVYTAEGSQQIAGTEEEPFVLRSLEGVRRMAFGELPAEDGLGAPRVESGIVPVRGFVHVTMDPAELEESERTALAEQVEKDGRSIEDPETKKRRAERPAPKPVKSTPPPSRPAASSSTTTNTSSASSRSGSGAGTSSGASAASEPAAPNMFDGLFGGGESKPAASAPAPASPAAPPAAAPSPAAAPPPEPAAPAAPAAADAAAASSSSGATAGTTGRKRRLVSSSLFDRRARSAPGEASQTASSQKDGATPAPASTPNHVDPAAADAPENASPDSVPEQTPAEQISGEKDSAEQPSPEQTPEASAPSADPVDAPAPPAEPVAASGADAAPSAPTTDAAPSAPTTDAAPTVAVDASSAVTDAEAAPAAPTSEAAPAAPTSEATPAEASPAEAAPAAPMPSTAPATPMPVPTPTPPVSIPTPEPPEKDLPGAAAEDELESPVTLVAPIDEEDHQDAAPAPAARRVPSARPAAAADAVGDLENTGAYDDLFGKTVFRRIEDAAVRRTEEEDEENAESAADAAAESPSPSSSPAPAEPDPEPAPAPETPRTSAPSEFIDWVPGVGRAAPEIAQAAARRAAAPPAPEPAYPQVHMAERPPAPNTGSRPAPVRPSMPMPPTPYEQPGAAAPAGPPMNTGAAGQQLGYQAQSGPPSPYPQPAVNPGAAGHQVGFRGPQAPGAHGGGNPPAPGWTGSPNPARPPQPGGPGPQYAAPQQQTPPHGAPPQGMPPQQGVARPGMPPPQGMPPQQARPGTPPPQQRPPQAAPAQTAHPSAPSAAGPGQSAGNAVTLPGLVCANGHANAPERHSCRFCGAPLQGETRTVVRPPLGTVLIAGGDRFVLDRTAIIGRRPRASRVSGNDVPQLITVPSPQQDISRSHLELRLEGWHVVALDLGTTNGTTLHREGFEPVRLRPREGAVLYDGDVLDLGDGVQLTFGERA